jgi:hypothetical protein
VRPSMGSFGCPIRLHSVALLHCRSHKKAGAVNRRVLGWKNCRILLVSGIGGKVGHIATNRFGPAFNELR